MENIKVMRSHTAGVVQRRAFNPNSRIISLNTLLTNGSAHGTNLIVIILAISAVSTNSQTQMQQRFNGNRGQVSSVRHDRRMVVMCPLSPAGVNTAMILFGAGCCERFFDADISLRDNGAIRKYTINYFNIQMLFYCFSYPINQIEMNKLTNVFILLFLGLGVMLLLVNLPGTD